MELRLRNNQIASKDRKEANKISEIAKYAWHPLISQDFFHCGLPNRRFRSAALARSTSRSRITPGRCKVAKLGGGSVLARFGGPLSWPSLGPLNGPPLHVT